MEYLAIAIGVILCISMVATISKERRIKKRDKMLQLKNEYSSAKGVLNSLKRKDTSNMSDEMKARLEIGIQQYEVEVVRTKVALDTFLIANGYKK